MRGHSEYGRGGYIRFALFPFFALLYLFMILTTLLFSIGSRRD